MGILRSVAFIACGMFREEETRVDEYGRHASHDFVRCRHLRSARFGPIHYLCSKNHVLFIQCMEHVCDALSMLEDKGTIARKIMRNGNGGMA